MRLVDIPLVIKLSGMAQLARGTQVKLDLLRWDEVDLSVEARLLEVEAGPGDDTLDEVEDALADEAELAAGVPPLDADPAQQAEAAESVEAGADAGADAAPPVA